MNVQNNDGWTPLHQAAYHNYTDLMKVLLQYGADRSIKTYRGKTALDQARRWNHGEAIQLLQQY